MDAPHEALTAAFAAAGYPERPSLVYWNVATKALGKGEAYALPRLGGSGRLVLQLDSDSSSILCGACLGYTADGKHLDTVHYCARSGLGGAVTHSGDTQTRGKSVHTITVALDKLPADAERLFFSLCACGPSNLSAFAQPYISLSDDASSGNFCRYALADAGTAPSALMAALVRGAGGGWSVVALGEQAKQRCCMNYSEVQEMCSRWSRQLGCTGADELTLPVAADTAGVELLSGFAAGMLKELIAPAAPASAAPTAATPAAKLRAALRGARYDAVRAAVAAVGEGPLAGYMPACADCDEEDAPAVVDDDDMVVVE